MEFVRFGERHYEAGQENEESHADYLQLAPCDRLCQPDVSPDSSSPQSRHARIGGPVYVYGVCARRGPRSVEGLGAEDVQLRDSTGHGLLLQGSDRGRDFPTPERNPRAVQVLRSRDGPESESRSDGKFQGIPIADFGGVRQDRRRVRLADDGRDARYRNPTGTYADAGGR